MTHSFPTRLSSDLHELAVVEAETVVAGRGEAEVVVRPVTDIQHHLGAKCGGHAGRGLDCETPILADARSEEHTSELQSLMRISYAVFCLKKQTTNYIMLNNKHIRKI